LECLSKEILFGERPLRRTPSDYVDNFNAEPNDPGKGNALPFPRNTYRHREGPVQCRERFGGLLRYYHREAVRWRDDRIKRLTVRGRVVK
jgi:putative transposase